MPDDDFAVPSEASLLAQRVDQLFRMSRPQGRVWTDDELAEHLGHERPDARITGDYLRELRTGRQANPPAALLASLAAFFGVEISYFFDQAHTDRVAYQLAVLEQLHNVGVRGAGSPPHRPPKSRRNP
ncbi:hypothetical protein [Actinoplanes sp. NPDC049316]|uniref:hypothetical protein n=1 Tax=Actinoplanes sp. NPDC049316 TaxID=3154727 RepID=UPI00342BC288